jgi:hypothetical protein
VGKLWAVVGKLLGDASDGPELDVSVLGMVDEHCLAAFGICWEHNDAVHRDLRADSDPAEAVTVAVPRDCRVHWLPLQSQGSVESGELSEPDSGDNPGRWGLAFRPLCVVKLRR